MKLPRAPLAALFSVSVLLAATFGPGREVGRLPAQLNEASDIANSRLDPNVFWVHNDSGDLPKVYAINRGGQLLGTYLLEGAMAVDWEDMAIGPAPGGGSYLYMADMGDNEARRKSIHIYRVAEPRIDPNPSTAIRVLTGVTSFEFVYEDGARDAESFMVDPLTNDFYFVTKREADGNRLYRAVAPSSTQVNRLVRSGTFTFTGAVSGDISPDGLQVLIRRYSNSLLAPGAATYWIRPDTSISLVDLLKQPGRIVPLVQEAQGEAIAFAADNSGFYTTTERTGTSSAPITFYPVTGP